MANLGLIPTDKIIERLQYENPWWLNRKIPEHFATMNRRLYFNVGVSTLTDKRNVTAV